jgi:hypothetical protein
MTGSYQAGFLIFAALAVLALVGLTGVKTRWRTTWGAAHLTAPRSDEIPEFIKSACRLPLAALG